MSKKKRISFVFELNARHLVHLLLQFISMNILIVLLFSGTVLYYAEKQLSLQAGDTTAQTYVEQPQGVALAPFLHFLLPENTKAGYRVLLSQAEGTRFWPWISGMEYRLFLPEAEQYSVLVFPLGEPLRLFLLCMLVLFLCEALELARSARKGARTIRRVLQPLTLLSETARDINQPTAAPIDVQMQTLKGTIDAINATRLDRRIPLDSAHEELKELSLAINGMLDRINEAYRSQVRFVSDASHELRTPIAVIQGYANLLDRWGKKDEKALQESIDAIKSEADSMKDLVEQLLFLARGDNESLALHPEELDLSALLAEVLRETSMIDQQHDFTSRIEENLVLTGDAQLIKQAVRIFVDNSIKYTPAGGRILLSACRQTDSVQITVQDSGIGIPPEELPHVFDRFFRADDSRARKTGGTGLGLSIARWIVDRHGGTVDILSRTDLGTRVTLTLPVG